jgi:hypothetical protein
MSCNGTQQAGSIPGYYFNNINAQRELRTGVIVTTKNEWSLQFLSSNGHLKDT